MTILKKAVILKSLGVHSDTETLSHHSKRKPYAAWMWGNFGENGYMCIHMYVWVCMYVYVSMYE